MSNAKTLKTGSLKNDLLDKYDFSNKNALITGGGSGLGYRFGTVLSSLGACVMLADVNEESVQKASNSIHEVSGVDVSYVKMDVTDPESVQNGFSALDNKFGPCDILICSAGISGAKWIEEMPPETWKKVIDVNLSGTFFCCQTAAKSMIPNKWGRIINIASIASRYAPWPKVFDGGYNYSASKAGVVGMSTRLAVELAPHNITVNSISPGILITPLTEKKVTQPELHQQIVDHVPMGRLGSPEDLDGLVMYLCSELSGFLTGQEIFIDGGYSLW